MGLPSQETQLPDQLKKMLPPILDLPAELLEFLCKYLPLENAGALSLTCKPLLNAIGHQYLDQLRGSWHQTAATRRFLVLLERDVPGYFGCQECLRFHSVETLLPPTASKQTPQIQADTKGYTGTDASQVDFDSESAASVDAATPVNNTELPVHGSRGSSGLRAWIKRKHRRRRRRRQSNETYVSSTEPHSVRTDDEDEVDDDDDDGPQVPRCRTVDKPALRSLFDDRQLTFGDLFLAARASRLSGADLTSGLDLTFQGMWGSKLSWVRGQVRERRSTHAFRLVNEEILFRATRTFRFVAKSPKADSNPRSENTGTTINTEEPSGNESTSSIIRGDDDGTSTSTSSISSGDSIISHSNQSSSRTSRHSTSSLEHSTKPTLNVTRSLTRMLESSDEQIYLCPHLQTGPQENNALTRRWHCMATHTLFEPCKKCARVVSCDYCSTEFQLRVVRVNARKADLTVTRWLNLGAARSPNDPLWRSHLWHRALEWRDGEPVPLMTWRRGIIHKVFGD